MKCLLGASWLWLCKLLKIPQPAQTSMRDKAVAVAGRVTIANNGKCAQVSCPVCLNVLQTKHADDIRMTLAVHLSLWHPEDVKLQWDIMQGRSHQSVVHLPSALIGVGVASAFGALLAISARNHRYLAGKITR